jgi:predicted Zn-dependent protease
LSSRFGDHREFREICEAMNRQFSSPVEPEAIHAPVATQVLLKDGLSEARAKKLVDLAKKPVAQKPDNVAYREACGGALYRAGEFAEAREQLLAAVEKRKSEVSVWTLCFLAMTEQKLNNPAAARDYLTKAVRQIEAAQKPRWEDRVAWHFLRAEAEQTVGYQVPPITASSNK